MLWQGKLKFLKVYLFAENVGRQYVKRAACCHAYSGKKVFIGNEAAAIKQKVYARTKRSQKPAYERAEHPEARERGHEKEAGRKIGQGIGKKVVQNAGGTVFAEIIKLMERHEYAFGRICHAKLERIRRAETNAEKHAIGRANGTFTPVNTNAQYCGEAYEHRQISDYIKTEQVNLRIFGIASIHYKRFLPHNQTKLT